MNKKNVVLVYIVVFLFSIAYASAILNENERIHEHVCIIFLFFTIRGLFHGNLLFLLILNAKLK